MKLIVERSVSVCSCPDEHFLPEMSTADISLLYKCWQGACRENILTSLNHNESLEVLVLHRQHDYSCETPVFLREPSLANGRQMLDMMAPVDVKVPSKTREIEGNKVLSAVTFGPTLQNIIRFGRGL